MLDGIEYILQIQMNAIFRYKPWKSRSKNINAFFNISNSNSLQILPFMK